MSRILLVGNDFLLLTTRAAVLHCTTADVVYCNSAEALEIVNRESFDLVVLCHSLTPKQTTEITETAHRRLPTATVLRVVSDISQASLAENTAFDAISPSGPRDLVRRASELLGLTPPPAAKIIEKK